MLQCGGAAAAAGRESSVAAAEREESERRLGSAQGAGLGYSCRAEKSGWRL
ncbi:MAG: hypothetical protein LBR77_06700 [Lachnospiraceae bacterium]|nr:hypothetical protein [Lachnospiraceae bacterium]